MGVIGLLVNHSHVHAPDSWSKLFAVSVDFCGFVTCLIAIPCTGKSFLINVEERGNF